jgi:hypothetical protein
MIEFLAYPKTPRLFRDVVVTEKIDGTNAAIGVTEDGEVYAQSRKRLITPEADNFGFARWVESRRASLLPLLGPGLHFGEWWGSGIQWGYGLTGADKRFSLFNAKRWGEDDLSSVLGLGVVPVLYEGIFDTATIRDQVSLLEKEGSQAAPGFYRPEGVVVYHHAANQTFKVLIENDELPKGAL